MNSFRIKFYDAGGGNNRALLKKLRTAAHVARVLTVEIVQLAESFAALDCFVLDLADLLEQ